MARLVNEQVEQCYLTATNYFECSFERPTIHFNQRGKIAGCARLQTNELRFNPVLLKDNLDTFINEVVPHEVSHLLTFILFGRVKPHGKEWQAIMTDVFKLKPNTRHQMDVNKVKGKTFLYQCQCGPVELSIRRHNKVIRGTQNYICRRCKEALKYMK
ncbi:MAG: SprT family zinc-dependent metalloprotease [Paraglaciecola sp.]|uniref:SprT family zinc-dependent metalloprotease n=1 Tax=Paraglaciecola sp. TaxID=1920173 RepID=UPI00329A23A5